MSLRGLKGRGNPPLTKSIIEQYHLFMINELYCLKIASTSSQ
jgi:hypothetical protein